MIITGIYNKTIFRNDKTGFTIFGFITKDCNEYKTKNGLLICTGVIPVFVKGMPLKITGEITYNSQRKENNFAITEIEEYSSSKNTTISFLTGDIFPGIGPKTAEKIINLTGDNVFEFIKRNDAKEILQNNITELNDENKVNYFIRTLTTTHVQKEIYDYLQKYGGNYNNALKLYELYGIDSLEILKKNCYKVGIEIDLPFEACDAIARNCGGDAFSNQRINSLLMKSLYMISNNGHVYSDMNYITKVANYIVKSSAFSEDVLPFLIARAAQKDKRITIEQDDKMPLYSLTELYNDETVIANEMNRIQNSSIRLPYDERMVEEIEKNMNIKYSENQKKAFSFLKSTGIKILTGGPGTGKTTTLNGIIKLYKKIKPDGNILLCAPTGRAAQKIKESTGMEASTIHKVLDFKPFGNEMICKSKIDQIDADFIIIDEMSMTDIQIFSMFLPAVKNNALVLLCGDVDQLPSVGAGNVLNDVIKSKRFEVDVLNVIYRQKENSNIIFNASIVNSGKTELKTGNDFKIIEVETADDIQNKIVEITKEKYNKGNPFGYQVLSSTKKGPAGVYRLNQALQNICNNNEIEMAFGMSGFKVGDKVMTIKNNYKNGYINGDLGIVENINEELIEINVNEEIIKIPRNEVGDVTLAYASTIHKSQGSEYDTVVIALPSEPVSMLKRKLLYTAITRAKKEIIIVAQKDTIQKSVSNNDDSERRTRLDDKINEIFNPIIKNI